MTEEWISTEKKLPPKDLWVDIKVSHKRYKVKDQQHLFKAKIRTDGYGWMDEDHVRIYQDMDCQVTYWRI